MTDALTAETGAPGVTPDPVPTDAPEADAPEAEASAEDTDTEDAKDNPGREAAKYRRQLREAESERDTLAGQVESLQRRMIEDYAGRQISRPEALWASGVNVADLLTEDGVPDETKVRNACSAASDRLGLARPVGGNYVPNEGRSTSRVGSGSSFADAFKPKSY